MIAFKRILCPVDFSEPSRKALRYAISLSLRYGAKLFIAHVVDTIAGHESLKSSADLAASDGLASNYAIKELEAFFQGGVVPGLKRVVLCGSPAFEILRLARQEDADLIAIGSRGRGGTLGRFLLGSTAEAIIENARCPILTVHHSEEKSATTGGNGEIPLRRILAALGLCQHSTRTLSYALSLANRYGATLYVLHVVEDVPEVDILAKIPISPPDIKKLIKSARARMLAMIGSMRWRLDQMNLVIRVGTPCKEIIEAAGEIGADLIVLGGHSREYLGPGFFVSTAHSVVCESHCPALIVRN